MKATYYYKLFRVKRDDGRVTTVSMDPVLVTHACRVVPGGIDIVGKLVRKAALSYKDGTSKNCSSFVAEQLRQEMKQASEKKKGAAALANA
ncbi:MAG: hypothetical protein Q7U16_01460 [Agitococcus sp.]|nr:hypothetical protein [Agitococcus sp.]